MVGKNAFSNRLQVVAYFGDNQRAGINTRTCARGGTHATREEPQELYRGLLVSHLRAFHFSVFLLPK